MFSISTFVASLLVISGTYLLIQVVLTAFFDDDLDSSHFFLAVAGFFLLFVGSELFMSSADASARRVICDATNGAEGEAHTWHCTLIHP